mgnify:CR=1 FL=1
MKFKDIDFGKVDAKNEFDANNKSEERKFEQAYILPDNVNIDTLINGGKSYVYGMKGTGKTALLKYLEIMIKKKKNSRTDFILFKTRFGEEERKTFNYQATTVVDKDQITDSGEIKDYEIVWRWFFYNYIIDYIRKSGEKILEFDSNWYSFYNTVMSARNEDEVGIKKYFPKIKKGNIKINIEIIKADAEWHNNSQEIKFSELIAKADKAFDNIKFIYNERLYILLDELELDYSNRNVYERDVRLIRDLIIFTDKFNHKCITREIPIKIITSVRMEVLTAIQSVGKEINKIIEDNGVQISWHQSGGNEKKHPLIHMIIRRFMIAEGLNDNDDNERIIRNKYFGEEKINDMTIERYILNSSWYRLRDIVRLLNLIKDDFPNNEKLTQQVFDGIRKTYSSKCWTECMEEMKAHYNNDDINFIRTIFNGWKRLFSLNDFSERIRLLSNYDKRAENFEQKQLIPLMELLYRVGIIGNRYKVNNEWRYRYAFRGDEQLLPYENMTVHYALAPFFSL